MDIIVLIVLFLLGSAIFGKRKRQSAPPEDTANGEEPMTWEEMERHYGLSMEPRTNEQNTANENTAKSDRPTLDTSEGDTVMHTNHRQSMETSGYGEDSGLSKEVERYRRYMNRKVDDQSDEIVVVKDDRRRRQALTWYGDREAAASQRAVLTKKHLTGTVRDGILWSVVLGPPLAKQGQYRRKR